MMNHTRFIKPTQVRVILTLALTQGWRISQLDVIYAFINGEITEEVYMAHLQKFKKSGSLHQIYKVEKALYSLKQTPRVWFDRLQKALQSFGFTSAKSD